MRPTAVILALLAGASPVAAQSAITAGMGTISCARLADDLAPGTSYLDTSTGLAAVAWAQGYISGVNGVNAVAHRRVVDMSGGRASELWTLMLSECRDNPQKTVGTIAAEFYAHNMR